MNITIEVQCKHCGWLRFTIHSATHKGWELRCMKCRKRFYVDRDLTKIKEIRNEKN